MNLGRRLACRTKFGDQRLEAAAAVEVIELLGGEPVDVVDQEERRVDEAGIGRTFREAPEIDGIVELPPDLPVGSFATVRVVDALGPDLVAETVTP